nr:glycosyltransferase [Nitrospiraceae bacterium]
MLKKACICVLAYNEERHIAGTLEAIIKNAPEPLFDIKVYPNGCTDRTVEIVRGLQKSCPRIEINELPQASKP